VALELVVEGLARQLERLDRDTNATVMIGERLTKLRRLEPADAVDARNITNEQPRITADGYVGALYQPYGRYLYASFGFSL
jgi:hypothetical protein